ncbi:MAG TPA: hypothetical protein PL182_08890 [Pseudobdellovibrionaceae bacterium]|nr:hypothetical protein [Pseudobdellovibrionaceae bacterium]
MISLFLTAATPFAKAAPRHPSKVLCLDRDTQAQFVITAQPENLYAVTPVSSNNGYLASSDILQSRYPILVTSVQADQDGRDLIEFVCKVNLKTSKFIEVLTARVTDYGLSKVQCLACEQNNFF